MKCARCGTDVPRDHWPNPADRKHGVYCDPCLRANTPRFTLAADTPTDDPDPATEGTGMKPAHPPDNPSNRTTRG